MKGYFFDTLYADVMSLLIISAAFAIALVLWAYYRECRAIDRSLEEGMAGRTYQEELYADSANSYASIRSVGWTLATILALAGILATAYMP